jgi:hypothetical protein
MTLPKRCHSERSEESLFGSIYMTLRIARTFGNLKKLSFRGARATRNLLFAFPHLRVTSLFREAL